MVSTNFRLDINGLRAFAVLSVVLFHFSVPYFEGGFIGVDVFFVISGFLMTGILLNKEPHPNILHFYTGRFLRIVPALVFVVLSLQLFGFFFLPSNEYETLSNNAIASLLFYSNNFYAIHSSYFDSSSESNLLLHTWSLSAEWQFYLIYPLIVIFIKKLKLPIGLTLVVLFSISLTITLSRAFLNKEELFYLLPTRSWEMLAGGLVFMASERVRPPLWMKNASIFGVLLIVISVFTLNSNQYWPSLYTLIPVLGAAIILLANNQKDLFTSNTLSQWAGKISYSVYLWHWPIVVLMKYYDVEFNFFNVTLGILSSFIAGHMSFLLIENTYKKRSKLMFNSIALIITLFVCLLISETKGLSFRFSNILKEVIEYRIDNSLWRPDSCFLKVEQQYSAFSSCPDIMTSKTFLVWGDSHAAHLLPGLRKVFGKELDITQRTAGLCAPLIGAPGVGPNCKNTNYNVANEIRDKKPYAVAMGALWSVPDYKTYLPPTIDFLVKSGVKKIIVFGPYPYWSKSLISVIEKTGTNPNGTAPWSMINSNVKLREYDSDLKKISMRYKNVIYISPLEVMCDMHSCKAIISDDKSYPIQYDEAHMTPEGAVWFINKVKDKIQ